VALNYLKLTTNKQTVIATDDLMDVGVDGFEQQLSVVTVTVVRQSFLIKHLDTNTHKKN